MSNTPRTNAYAAQGREWIPLGIFEKLESELNEANRTIAEAKTHLQEVDLPDEPIDIQAKRLRDAHDWQAGIAAGYEKQIQSANERLQKLNDAMDAANSKLQKFLDERKEVVERITAENLRLRSILQSIDLSPCNGGSCMVATDADDLIQSALTTPPPSVVDKQDASHLLSTLELIIREDNLRNNDGLPIMSMWQRAVIHKVINTYRAKYQEIK
jgi:hypothetical protein